MSERSRKAQKKSSKRAEAIKLPFDIKASSQPDGILLEWRRSPGIVDGFIIYLGINPDNIQEVKRVPCGFKQVYSDKITDLEGDQDYHVTIAAYIGDKTSRMPTPLQVKFKSGTKKIMVGPKSSRKSRKRTSRAAAICGYCNGDVVLNRRIQIFECSDCEEQYVQRVGDGKFRPLDIFVNGICGCCSPKRPLTKPEGEQHIVCSNSGERYVELDGKCVKLSELDYGLCTCCQPPRALILNQQSQVVCSEKRDHLYTEENGQYVYSPPETPAGSFDEINEALSDGSAVMLPNGVLVNNNDD